MEHSALRPRRRWPLIAVIGTVAVLAAVWTGIWFYASARARTALEGWRAREAQSGRVYDCGEREFGGFPFRIEVRCSGPVAEWRNFQPPFMLEAQTIHVAAQVYDPTLLIAEITGPLQIGAPKEPPSLAAQWRLAQVSLRGRPRDPQRVSLVFDAPQIESLSGPAAQVQLTAERLELHGRMAGGSAAANPLIELVLRAAQVSLPNMGPLLARQPLDLDVEGQLSGLKDFSAKPWRARLREIQARGGKLEIVRARLRQGEVIAVAGGMLGLTPSGHLDGELQVTVANLEKILPALGIDAQQPEAPLPGKLNNAVNALNRLAPGLGDVARERAAPAIVAGVNLLGAPAELEGQRAVTLPLRFDDGKVRLGPLRIGQTPALF